MNLKKKEEETIIMGGVTFIGFEWAISL